jgi:energy-coupling factor transporter ATP-binding protein EcfA2
MTHLPLVIENLSFRYHSRNELALQNISFSVEKGEILLIAGASGCGKTTLARCINGLIPRSYKGEIQGHLLIQGKEMRNKPLAQVSRNIGTVLQDPERQILGTRVVNEVAFGLENLGLPRAQIILAVKEALERLGITHLQDRETFHLSGGEKQKVALAGVVAMNPSILLLDEPLASLDPASAQEALTTFRRLADEGMTMLIVEHRVEDVLQINPERVLFMEEGQIRYLGPVSGLYGAVNYHQVKLPAPEIIRLAKADPPPTDFIPLLSGQKTATPLVVFDKVSFWYESDLTILKDISLEINQGDIIAVLGPNGAGKTTLVKHAIGLLKPKSGRVMIDGRNTQEMSVAQIAAKLGYVFQSPSHMLFAPTVRDELAFGPTNLGHTPAEIEKEVSESLDTVHLEGMEKNPPLSLSFGQQKRVSIAAVLAMRSQILIMDEPTAGQDYQNYMDFMNTILQMPGFKAVLFITHDVDLAVVYANRVLLMDQGGIVADGNPAEVMGDFDRLKKCRVVPTSLLKVNLEYFPKTHRFLRAEMLAHV